MVLSKKKTIRLCAFMLALLLCISLLSPIAMAERGSAYIFSYGADMSAGNNGKVTAWFTITGTGMMDQIGSTTINIYENGTFVKSYSHTTTTGMMASDKFYHSGSVTYDGTVGKSYYAFITYQCGKNGDWDNRSLQSPSVTAKW